MKRIVVLISGRGSNMVSIAQAMRDERWPARIACVIADRPAAAGLERAREHGIETAVVDYRARASRGAFEAALAETIDRLAPDAVVLAGFMRILGDAFVDRYARRMLNIHPSLLPAFPGLATHRRALESGVAVHGATVHFVGRELDLGPIVAQAALAVRPDDDEPRLAARVLALEHRLYPMAVRWLVEERLRIEGERVVLQEPRPGETRCLWGG